MKSNPHHALTINILICLLFHSETVKIKFLDKKKV